MGLQEGAAFAECGLGSVVMAIAMLSGQVVTSLIYSCPGGS